MAPASGRRTGCCTRGAAAAEQCNLGFRGFAQEGGADGAQPCGYGLTNFETAASTATAALTHADTDHVLGVDGEVVAEREAPARIEGQIVADALVTVAGGYARGNAKRGRGNNERARQLAAAGGPRHGWSAK